ncbi:MAG: hypothetical protein ACR2OZ_09990 [Verrucomicrobiales bacterium]
MRCPSREERRLRSQQQIKLRRRQLTVVVGTLMIGALTVLLIPVLWASQLKRAGGAARNGQASRPGVSSKDGVRHRNEAGAGLDVLAEQKKENGRQQAALLSAQQAVLRFLQASQWLEARTFLHPPANQWDRPPRWFVPEMWVPISKQPLELMQSRRNPAGGFFSSWQAVLKNAQRLTFLVDAGEEGSRLRWQAIEQQIEGGLARFSRASGASRGEFYVRLSPRDRSGQRGDPDLIVKVSSPFGGADECFFDAVITGVGGDADHWRNLLNISAPRETTARLSWSRRTGSQPTATVEPLATGQWESRSSTVAVTR